MKDEDGESLGELLAGLIEGILEGGAPLWLCLIVLILAMGFFLVRHYPMLFL